MKKEIFKYSVVKKEENTEDSLIEQSGGTVKFTLKSIVEEIGLYNKKKQEIDAKKQLSQSVIENIKENNPDIIKTIEELPEKTIKAIFLYEKANIEVNASNELLKQIDEAIDNDGKELEEIVKQTGLSLKVEKPE